MATEKVVVECKEIKVIPSATDSNQLWDDEDTAEAFATLDEQYGQAEGGMGFYIGNLCCYVGSAYRVEGTKKKFVIECMDVPATYKSLRDGNIIEGAIFKTNKGKVYVSVEDDVWLMDNENVVSDTYCEEI